MANSLYSQSFKDFFRGIGKAGYSIRDIIDYTQESLDLIADDIHLGRLESVITATPNAVERVGYHGQDVLYQSKNGYDPTLFAMEFNTVGGINIFMNAYPSKGYEWDAEDKDDLYFVCASFFSLFERARMRSMLENAAYTESMTGALNINGIIRQGAKLQAQKELTQYTVAFFNIKDFKFLNGEFGMETGNMVLRGLVDNIYGFLIPDEIIARIGGDNFVAVVRTNRIDGFLNFINPMRFESADHQKIEISFRVGLYPMKEGEEIGAGVSKSGTALNETRREGNTDVVWFTQEILNRVMNVKKSTFQFADALQNREFEVYYQPKVRLEDGKLCGSEALVRWIQNGDVVPPMSFIPALEQDGTICDLDMYVFDTVCRDIRNWLNQGIEPVKVSTNFSRLHIKDHDFAKKIIMTIERYGIDTKYVEVEITESACFEDTKKLKDFLSAMKENGIHVSIDDFGTGYSSLALLKDMMVDVIKLDQSFIKGIQSADENEMSGDKVVIKNVIKMVEELDMEIIAEGVETGEAAQFLRSVKCDMAQGYLYNRPMPRDEFDVLLKGDREYNMI